MIFCTQRDLWGTTLNSSAGPIEIDDEGRVKAGKELAEFLDGIPGYITLERTEPSPPGGPPKEEEPLPPVPLSDEPAAPPLSPRLAPENDDDEVKENDEHPKTKVTPAPRPKPSHR